MFIKAAQFYPKVQKFIMMVPVPQIEQNSNHMQHKTSLFEVQICLRISQLVAEKTVSEAHDKKMENWVITLESLKF